MAVNIPRDVLADILTRLPVRDLLRYRSVAKLWRSLIDDPGFIKMQLDHATKTASGLGVVIRKTHRYLDWVNLDFLDMVQKLDVPKRRGADIEFLGSCNGLVALLDFALLDFNDDWLAIWNPSTRRYRELELPNSMIIFPFTIFWDERVYYGFAYDRVSDDYKLLRLVQRRQYADSGYKCFDCKAEVYSAKSDCWKMMGNVPYILLGFHQFGVVASNSLHFLACRDPVLAPLIVAFDLEKEAYLEVPTPSFDDQTTLISLDVLGGSLCAVFTSNVSLTRRTRIELWIMKEYGAKESWTKLSSFVVFGHVISIRTDGNNRILLNRRNKIVIYDLAGEWIADLRFRVPRSIPIFRAESLVGLDESDGNGWQTHH